eukprot:Skav214431  [mRNA]  locus=scaffold586:374389:375529:+ [translate_table: standard]
MTKMPSAVEWPRGSHFQVLHSMSARVSPRELLGLLRSVADAEDFQQQLQRPSGVHRCNDPGPTPMMF